MAQLRTWEPREGQRVYVDWGLDQLEARVLNVAGPPHRRNVRVAVAYEDIGPTSLNEEDYFIVTLPLGAVHEERDA
jgi:hypothetical protein